MSEERENKLSRYLESIEKGGVPSAHGRKAHRINSETKCSKLLRFIAMKPRSITDVKIFFNDTNVRRCQSSLTYLCKQGKIKYVPGHYEFIEGSI